MNVHLDQPLLEMIMYNQKLYVYHLNEFFQRCLVPIITKNTDGKN